jgi:hypothetical protein
MSEQAEFNGECAFAVSLGKKGVTGKESCYLIQDGKKFLFSNPVAKLFWRVLPGRRQKAEATWSGR